MRVGRRGRGRRVLREQEVYPARPVEDVMRNRAAQRRHLANSVPCTATADCGYIFAQCVGGLCQVANKTCPHACSGAGACQFLSMSGFEQVPICQAGDPTCTAMCSCKAGYSGLGCEYSGTTMKAKASLRRTLLTGLYNVTQKLDATAQTVAQWSTQVNSLTKNYWELDAASTGVAAKLVTGLVANAASLSLPYAQVLALRAAVNNIAWAATSANISLAAGAAGTGVGGAAGLTSADAVTADIIESMLKTYNALVSTQLVAGQ